MAGNRRAHLKPYLFEVLIAAAFATTGVLAFPSRHLLGSVGTGYFALAFLLFCDVVTGVGIRSIIAAARRDRGYFRVIRSQGWLFDTARLVAVGALTTLTYAWIKLVVPIYHPRLFDRELWNLDARLTGGYSPTVLSLELFSNPTMLRAIDWSYPNIFFASIAVASAFFISHPSRRLRVAYATGKTLLSLSAAVLYLLIPSLGPAFRFPQVWFAYSDHLRTTQQLQSLLLTNYQNVLRAWERLPHGHIQPLFGIGAFPSLHVALQLFMYLWMRKLWKSGQILFAIFFACIMLGSLVTGWHYLVDGLAGIVMAVVAYALSVRLYSLRRWFRLRRN